MEPPTPLTLCASCKAPIRWATLPSGKRLPIDCEPHAHGTVRLSPDGKTATVLTTEQVAEMRGKVLLYRTHFATCPSAGKHRKPKS
jgi:hypothetical protein